MCVHFLFVAADIQFLCLHWEDLKWRKWSTAGKRLFRPGHFLSLSCFWRWLHYSFPAISVRFPVLCIWFHIQLKHNSDNFALQVLTGSWNNSYIGMVFCYSYYTLEIVFNSFLLFWKFPNHSNLKILGIISSDIGKSAQVLESDKPQVKFWFSYFLCDSQEVI